MKTFLGYYSFSLKSLTHKISVWIVFAVYQFYFILALFLLPLMRRSSPFDIWSFSFQNLFSSFNTAINIHVLTFILCAIFSVFLVVHIFKNDLVDGSRLLISSKPINKAQIMLCKLLVYFTTAIFTVFVSLIIAAFALILPDARANIGLYNSLFISILVDGILLFLVFGGLSILLSSFMNQVGLMICIVGGAVTFTVFDIVGPWLGANNTTLIASRTGATVDTYKYVAYNGEIRTMATLDNDRLDLKDEWNKVNATSPRRILSFFDITNQLVTPLNMAKWESILDDQTARGALGANPLYTYHVNDIPALQAWYENPANVIMSMVPIFTGSNSSIQNGFGSMGYSYNLSTYDEITEVLGISPIGYYISAEGPMVFVNFDDLTAFADPEVSLTRIEAFVHQLAISHDNYMDALIALMQANKSYFGSQNDRDYFNITSMKIFFNATRIIQEEFWKNQSDDGLMDTIFFEGGTDITWDDITSKVLNDLYTTGEWTDKNGQTHLASEEDYKRFVTYSNLYRDIFYDINSWSGWDGTTSNNSLLINIPTVNFGSMDLLKHAYNYTASRTISIPGILGFWFSISILMMAASIIVSIRKDVF